MKNLISIILAIIVLASCSTTNTFNKGPFQKRKYNKGFYINKKSNVTAINKQTEIVPTSVFKETLGKEIKTQERIEKAASTILPIAVVETSLDSVKVTLKNGDSYIGVIVEEDTSGCSVRQNDGRIVYLLKKDIKDRVSLKNYKTVQKIEEAEVQKAVEPYSYIAQKQKPLWVKEKNTHLKAPSSSNSALVIFCISLLITFASPSLAVISLILFIIGVILSIIGFNQAKKEPSVYNTKRAKRTMWLYLAPIFLLLSLTGVALIAFSL